MKLHTAGEDYLEAVLILQKKLGMVRSVDVARYMEVSKPSVCYAVGTLREGGFLTTDEKHYLHLTERGRDVAEKIYERHCFLTKHLISILYLHRRGLCPLNDNHRLRRWMCFVGSMSIVGVETK